MWVQFVTSKGIRESEKSKEWFQTYYHNVLPCVLNRKPFLVFLLFSIISRNHLTFQNHGLIITTWKSNAAELVLLQMYLYPKFKCSYGIYPPDLFKLKMFQTELKLCSQVVLLFAVATSSHSSKIFPKSVTHRKPGRAQQMCLLWFCGYLYN